MLNKTMGGLFTKGGLYSNKVMMGCLWNQQLRWFAQASHYVGPNDYIR